MNFLNESLISNGKTNFSLVPGLPATRARAGGAGDDFTQGQGEHHDPVMAHDDGVRTPLVGCVISGRNHSFDALVATRECVLNIPAENLAKQVVSVGNCSGKRGDKFKKFKLTPLPASHVESPLIAADRRVLRQSRMQVSRYPDGEQIQLLRAGGNLGMDSSRDEEPAHFASPGQGYFHGGGQNDQAALKDEVTRMR